MLVLEERPQTVVVVQPVEAERMCPNCPHAKRMHSQYGCTYTEEDGQVCPCTTRYMDI